MKAAQAKKELSELNILGTVETRWVSNYKPMERVSYCLPALIDHANLLEQTSTGADHSSAIEQLTRLTDLERVFAMAALHPMLHELHTLVQVHRLVVYVYCCVLQDLIHFVQCLLGAHVLLQVLQKSTTYVHHMLDAINYSVKCLEELYCNPNTSFDVRSFEVLHSFEAVLKKPELSKSSPLVLEAEPGSRVKTIHMKTGKGDTVPMRATPRPTGLPGCRLTTLGPVSADECTLLYNDVKGASHNCSQGIDCRHTPALPS